MAEEYPWHGEKVTEGRLTGKTDTDYFYFFCPDCKEIMQAEFERFTDNNKVLHIGLRCSNCNLNELCKIPTGDAGWQGGKF